MVLLTWFSSSDFPFSFLGLFESGSSAGGLVGLVEVSVEVGGVVEASGVIPDSSRIGGDMIFRLKFPLLQNEFELHEFYIFKHNIYM